VGYNGSRAAPIRVLLADDDPKFVYALSTLIDVQPELTIVGTAGDGLEAIELAERLEPEAIVIDLHMPRLDGVTAIARLRRDHPNVCLIAVTGDDAPALHRAVTEAGADAVLVKGDLMEALLTRLGALHAAAATRAPSN
jgi:DNA-binding NarL/FixJ family response regulator